MLTTASTTLRTFVSAFSTKAAASVVDSLLNENKVVVFSKSYCPFAARAKQSIGAIIPEESFAVYECDIEPEGSDVQSELRKRTGSPTVPQVFIEKQFIGGGDETSLAAHDGTLKQMLVKAGVLKE
eukprot:JP448141.1.p1 GENE.JP448141.1~~JP448141.1.p1  ORF type:complete len:126 (-),score=21.39 JP448141.1:83-460(-)